MESIRNMNIMQSNCEQASCRGDGKMKGINVNCCNELKNERESIECGIILFCILCCDGKSLRMP